jgi:hypothetical protein
MMERRGSSAERFRRSKSANMAFASSVRRMPSTSLILAKASWPIVIGLACCPFSLNPSSVHLFAPLIASTIFIVSTDTRVTRISRSITFSL